MDGNSVYVGTEGRVKAVVLIALVQEVTETRHWCKGLGFTRGRVCSGGKTVAGMEGQGKSGKAGAGSRRSSSGKGRRRRRKGRGNEQ